MRPRIVHFLQSIFGAGIFVPDNVFLQSVAIVLGIYLALRQAEKAGLDVEKVFRACLITVGFALISARLYVVLEYLDYYRQQPWEIFQYWKGGLASYGAFIGGAVAAIVAAKVQRLSAAKFLDCCAPSIALAITLSRLGCFLNGCCYGEVSSLPWAVRFPEGSGPYEAQFQAGLIGRQSGALPVHPTQLYEALYALALAGLLFLHRNPKKGAGYRFALLFIMYPVGRFLNEFLRGDDRGFVSLLSLPQVFSAVAIILSIFFLMRSDRASPRTKISATVFDEASSKG